MCVDYECTSIVLRTSCHICSFHTFIYFSHHFCWCIEKYFVWHGYTDILQNILLIANFSLVYVNYIFSYLNSGCGAYTYTYFPLYFWWTARRIATKLHISSLGELFSKYIYRWLAFPIIRFDILSEFS